MIVSQLMIHTTQHVPWLIFFQMQVLIFLWAQGRGAMAIYIL